MDQLGAAGFVERLRFFNGQQLFAPDLQSIEEFDRGMRELHNRSLHQPGIGNGFAVSGRRGDRQVAIQAGYATDAAGREIVLLETLTEQVPPVSGEPGGGPAYFDLTVSYPSDDDLAEAETREGVCLPRGAVRLREKPVFCWVRLHRYTSGELRAADPSQATRIQSSLLIVLARAEVLNCQLNADLSIAQRRSARPPQQPVIRCATATVQWRPWTLSGGETTIGLTATVDTTAAAFRTTPCYSARISGTRPLEINVDNGNPLVLLDGPAYIQNPAPGGFDCYIPVLNLGTRSGSGPDLDLGSWSESGLDRELLQRVIHNPGVPWAVTWLAIED